MKIGSKLKIPNNLTVDPCDKRGQTGKLIANKLGIYTIQFSDGKKGEYFASIWKKYAQGGKVKESKMHKNIIKSDYSNNNDVSKENSEMVLNQNTQIKHHTEELKSAVKAGAKVPAWVVAKINRSANDISDATHYLEGTTKMEQGGGVANEDRDSLLDELYDLSDRLIQHKNHEKKVRNIMYNTVDVENIRHNSISDIKLAIKQLKSLKSKMETGGAVDGMIKHRVEIGLKKYKEAILKAKVNSLQPASPEKYYVLNELEYNFKLPYSINSIKDIEENKSNYLEVGTEYLKLRKQYNDTDPVIPTYLYSISDCSKLSKEGKVEAKKLLTSYMKIVIKDFKLKKKEFGYRGKTLKQYSFETGGNVKKGWSHKKYK